jgi:hypothetical protein
VHCINIPPHAKNKQLSIYNTDLFVHVYQNTNNLIISADQSIINQYSPFRPLARGHAARQMVELDMDSEDDDTTEADYNETQTFEENGMHFGEHLVLRAPPKINIWHHGYNSS